MRFRLGDAAGRTYPLLTERVTTDRARANSPRYPPNRRRMPNHEKISILIFMTGRNCARYVEDAVFSIARQTHTDTHVLFVDDASDDGTGDVAEAALTTLMPGRFQLVRNSTRMGKAYNAATHLRLAARAHHAVAVVDADDMLIDMTILAQLSAAYRRGMDVVWTNYVTDAGRTGGNGPLDRRRSPRLQPWVTSHLFSFRAALLDRVPDSYFQYPDGRWLEAACDFALAYPILDQSRRYEFIPVAAYRYTESNPQSHHNLAAEQERLTSPRQRACAQLVLDMPPLPRTDVADQSSSAAPAVCSLSSPLPDSWEAACAMHLSQVAPELMAVVPAHQLTELDGTALLGWLQDLRRQGTGSVLCVGTGPQVEAALTLAKASGHHTVALFPSPSLATIEQADVALAAPWAEYILSDHPCYLPDVSQLKELAGFASVFLAANAWGAERQPVTALAVLAPLMADSFFTIWMSGLTGAEVRVAQAQLAQDMPDIDASVCGHRRPCLRIAAGVRESVASDVAR